MRAMHTVRTRPTATTAGLVRQIEAITADIRRNNARTAELIERLRQQETRTAPPPRLFLVKKST